MYRYKSQYVLMICLQVVYLKNSSQMLKNSCNQTLLPVWAEIRTLGEIYGPDLLMRSHHSRISLCSLKDFSLIFGIWFYRIFKLYGITILRLLRYLRFNMWDSVQIIIFGNLIGRTIARGINDRIFLYKLIYTYLYIKDRNYIYFLLYIIYMMFSYL